MNLQVRYPARCMVLIRTSLQRITCRRGHDGLQTWPCKLEGQGALSDAHAHAVDSDRPIAGRHITNAAAYVTYGA